MQHDIIRQFVSFAGVGAIATGVQYLILVILVQFDVMAALASGIGYTLSSFLNYYLNYKYTFKSVKNHREAMFKFFTVAMIGLVLNTLAMIIFVEYLQIYYLFAQIGATGVVLIWSFAANKIWTFKHNP